jgi:alpha-1,2-mannosyltransferase
MNALARPDEADGHASRLRWPWRAGEPGLARIPALVTALVAATALAVRLWPLIGQHMLNGLLEYDDGVHYDAAAHLIGGALPYRDFVFIQPPGVLLLLAPFAAAGRLAGDEAAMTAARLAIAAVAAVNVALLMRLVHRQAGRTAGVIAGATYAVWGGAAAAERTVLLEPLLGLGLLGAMTLLGDRLTAGRRTAGDTPARRHRRRLAAAGLLLGLALAVKTWAVADIVLLAGWLGWHSGRRAAAAFAATALAAAAALCLPFFLAAPGAMFHQVISDQLGRTERLTPDPVVFWHEVAGVGQVYGRSGAPPAAAIAVLAGFVLAVAVTLWRGPRIWAVLAIVQLALVLPQPSYTYHYIDFAAPALAACAGIAAAALLRAARRVRAVPVAVAVVARVGVVAVLAVFAWQAVTQVVVGSPVQAQFRGFFAAHPCAFSDYPSLLAAADAESRQVRLHCANLVDYTGAALAVGDGKMLVRTGHPRRGGLYRFPGWQAQVRAILARSDAAVLSWRPERWTPATQQFFHQRFRKLAQVGYFTLWILRT